MELWRFRNEAWVFPLRGLLLVARNHVVLCFCFFTGAKEHNLVPQLIDFEIPTSFWYGLKSLTEALMDNVNCESPFWKPKHMNPDS